MRTENGIFKWLVLVAIGLVAAATGGNMIAFAPILGDVAYDLGLSLPAAQSSFLGIFIFVVAIATLVSGALADRLGMVPVLLLASIVGALPNLLFPFLGFSYGWVVALRVAQGFGAGAVFALIPLCAAHWFSEEERGRVAGIGMTMLNAGIMLGVFLSPRLYQQAGNWRATMGWFGAVEAVLFLYVGYIAWNYKAHEPAHGRPCPLGGGKSGGGGSVKAALLNPTTYIGILMCMLISWLLNALNDLTPQYFALNAPIGVGFGRVMAGQLMLVVQIGTILGGLVAGLVMDKVFRGNPKPVLLIGFSLAAATVYSLLLPSIYGNMAVLVVMLFLAGLAVAFLNPAAAVFTTRAYPESIVGRVVGLWLGIGAFGGSLGIFASALALHKTGTYQLTISIFAAVGMVGLILSQLLKQRERIYG
jgi:MFS family permease